MNILHYALGFPPYRTGGLTKYCIDLMKGQMLIGNTVAMVWPGKIGIVHRKVSIKERKPYFGIKSYEIQNPLPVALDEGIIDTEKYMENGDKEVYREFLMQIRPDVLHIHTLMGFHRELVEAAKKIGIRTVFTTHDYYGICPKVTLYCNGSVCDCYNDGIKCVQCNITALSHAEIIILQSSIYRRAKNVKIVKWLRNRHRNKYFSANQCMKLEPDCNIDVSRAVEYRKLREFYLAILNKVDVIHCNSKLSQSIYSKYLPQRKMTVTEITHASIKDCRKKRDFRQRELRITYLGTSKPFKGFDFLLNALDILWNSGEHDFKLNLYSTSIDVSEKAYIGKISNGYEYKELEKIFDGTDLLVVPSQWYETFGFTVLEAISYGIPVLASNLVGACQISNVLCFKYSSTEEFNSIIRKLIKKRCYLEDINKKILQMDFSEYLLANHTIKMVTNYYL